MSRAVVRARNFFESAGNTLLKLCDGIFDFFWLVVQTLRAFVSTPFYLSATVEQFRLLIYNSLPLVLITACSTGAVMALQFGYGMSRFGGKLYVPTVVAISLVRDLGPVFTGLMLAGRTGAGISAELGSMKVTQQVDAIRALGTDPIRKLVAPRVLVLLIGAPILTILADLIGMLGGMIVSAAELNISTSLYIQKSVDAVGTGDYLLGTAKAIIFGGFIGFIACLNGLNTHNGTTGIGSSTTKTVVMSSTFIMIADVIMTKLGWIFKW